MIEIAVFDLDALIDEHGNFTFRQEIIECFQKLHRNNIDIKITTFNHPTVNNKILILDLLDRLLGAQRSYLKATDIYTLEDLRERRKEAFDYYSLEDFTREAQGTPNTETYIPMGAIHRFFHFHNNEDVTNLEGKHFGIGPKAPADLPKLDAPQTLGQCKDFVNNFTVAESEASRMSHVPLLNLIRKDYDNKHEAPIPPQKIIFASRKGGLDFVKPLEYQTISISEIRTYDAERKPEFLKQIKKRANTLNPFQNLESLYLGISKELTQRLSAFQQSCWVSKTSGKAAHAILNNLKNSNGLSTEEKLKSLYFTLLEQKDFLAKAPKSHFIIGNPNRAVNLGLTNIQKPLSKLANTQHIVATAKTSYYLKTFQNIVSNKTKEFKKSFTRLAKNAEIIERRIEKTKIIKTEIKKLTYINKDQYSQDSTNFKKIHSYLMLQREKLLETDPNTENFEGYGRHSQLHKMLDYFIAKIEETALKADVSLAPEKAMNPT